MPKVDLLAHSSNLVHLLLRQIRYRVHPKERRDPILFTRTNDNRHALPSTPEEQHVVRADLLVVLRRVVFGDSLQDRFERTAGFGVFD